MKVRIQSLNGGAGKWESSSIKGRAAAGIFRDGTRLPCKSEPGFN